MNYIYVKNKKNGTTYVYESISYWVPELGQPRAHRTLIGKLDENGNIVPTASRGHKDKKSAEEKKRDYDLKNAREKLNEAKEAEEEAASMDKQTGPRAKMTASEKDTAKAAELLRKDLAVQKAVNEKLRSSLETMITEEETLLRSIEEQLKASIRKKKDLLRTLK